MTAQGMSADQAAQDLRHTIMSLQNPSQQQVNEMQQLGLNSNDLAKNLGKRGLTGTIDELQHAVIHHMGRSGEVLMKAFNQSKSAARDATIMIGHMPPALARLSRGYLDGTTSAKQWRKETRALPPLQRNLANQFATVANKAHGFNQLLKSGQPAAQTYAAAMSKAMGGTTGLTTALMVGGGHMDTYKANVKAIGDAASHTSGHVKGWQEIQHNFNFQLGSAAKAAKSVGISFGTVLLPAATKAMKDIAHFGQELAHHAAAAKGLAAVVGVLLGGALEHKLVKGLKVSAEGFKDLAKPITGTIGLFRKGDDGVSKFGSAMTKLKGLASASASGVQTAWSGVKTVFSSAKTGITAAADAAKEWKIWSKAAAGATKIWSGIQAGFNAVMDANPIALTVVAIAALVTGFVLLWTHCKGFRDFWTGLWHDVQHIVADAVNWIRGHWKLILGILTGPVGAAVIFITSHWHQVLAVFDRVWHGVEDVTKTVWDAIKKIVSTAAGWIGSFLHREVTGWTRIIHAAWDAIRDVTRTVWAWLESFVHREVTGIMTVLSWFSRLGQLFHGWFMGAYHAAAHALGAVVTTVHGLPRRILSALGNLGHLLWQGGVNLVMGLVHGIESVASAPVHAMSSLISDVRSFLPFSPAKRGPLSGSGSPDIAGAKIPAMLAEGITGGATLVAAAAQSMAAAAVILPADASVPPAATGAGAAAASALASPGRYGRTGVPGVVQHNHFQLTVNGYVGDERELVEAFYPALEEVVLAASRRNPVTGNGLSLGAA